MAQITYGSSNRATMPEDMESILIEMSEGSLTKDSINKLIYPEAKV